MEKEKSIYAELRRAVEKTFGMKLVTPKHFDALSYELNRLHACSLSSTTLRRFWGYQEQKENSRPSYNTLNILARYVGCIDFESFVEAQKNSRDEESGFIHSRSLNVRTLTPKTMLMLQWRPDRSVLVRFEGQDLFSVVESKNSKLRAGDYFHCSFFVDGEPLLLSCLLRKDCEPTDYVCGKVGGIKFNVVRYGAF